MSQNKNGLPKRKSINFNLNRKLNRKWIYETNSVKYLGIKIDSKLDWRAHIDDIALKLIRANSLLYKVRDFANAGILSNLWCPIWITYSSCMPYMAAECMQIQSFFHTPKKNIKIDSFLKNPYWFSLFQIKNGESTC